MDVAALLTESFGRIPDLARRAVTGLTVDQLVARPGPDANPIAWLVWHLARVQDAQVAELVPADQVWVTGDWATGVGLDPDPGNTGYGHSSVEVATVRPRDGRALLDYLDAVAARSTAFVAGLDADALDRVVDRRWDPPVTLGVRLVSVVDDCVQHAGQAAYARGLLGA
ncbi:MAG TPA: DinB family protein [Acidimicrobiales bacterium]|nr:DinB family protein [Acidimicrobiales bacterium]